MNTKYFFSILCFAAFICVSSCLNAQTDSLQITLTDMRCQLIDMLSGGKDARTLSHQFDCPERAESGTVNLITHKKDTLKILLSSAQGSHSGQDVEYYFNDGKLSFYRIRFSVWTFDPEFSNDSVPQTIDYFTLREMYFQNDKAIMGREKNYLVKSSLKQNLTEADVEFIDSDCVEAAQIVSDFYVLLKFFRSKPRNGSCPFE